MVRPASETEGSVMGLYHSREVEDAVLGISSLEDLAKREGDRVLLNIVDKLDALLEDADDHIAKRNESARSSGEVGAQRVSYALTQTLASARSSRSKSRGPRRTRATRK